MNSHGEILRTIPAQGSSNQLFGKHFLGDTVRMNIIMIYFFLE